MSKNLLPLRRTMEFDYLGEPEFLHLDRKPGLDEAVKPDPQVVAQDGSFLEQITQYLEQLGGITLTLVKFTGVSNRELTGQCRRGRAIVVWVETIRNRKDLFFGISR